MHIWIAHLKIDRGALAKQGDNALSSIHLSVRVCQSSPV